ncbi:MAG: hypothetical protein IH630_08645 [Thermoplasmata archaeon]|nr:hypothetical protein [Thermoplasmata archaeon]TFG70070.1 MAG: hypothetical protein E4H25_03195 [Methanomassiliicoccus sp.]
MKAMTTINANGHMIHILPVIKGLKSEADKVKDAFEKVQPNKVAISLSKEEIEGLRNLPDDYEPELSRYDEIYVSRLGRYGEVAAPPPCYVAAVELSDHFGIPLVPVDLDEVSYTDLYCAAVTGSALFRHSTRTWALRHRSFNAETPEEFVVLWDRVINGMQGFRLIESKRVEAMAKGILDASTSSKDLLVVLELERAQEVSERIKEAL